MGGEVGLQPGAVYFAFLAMFEGNIVHKVFLFISEGIYFFNTQWSKSNSINPNPTSVSIGSNLVIQVSFPDFHQVCH